MEIRQTVFILASRFEKCNENVDKEAKRRTLLTCAEMLSIWKFIDRDETVMNASQLTMTEKVVLKGAFHSLAQSAWTQSTLR